MPWLTTATGDVPGAVTSSGPISRPAPGTSPNRLKYSALTSVAFSISACSPVLKLTGWNEYAATLAKTCRSARIASKSGYEEVPKSPLLKSEV